MLRGVNKRIIEVKDTGSDLFEKALFFVKDNEKFNEAVLEKEAKKITKSYFSESKEHHQGYLRYTDLNRKRKRKKYVLALLLTLCCAGIGIVIRLVV